MWNILKRQQKRLNQILPQIFEETTFLFCDSIEQDSISPDEIAKMIGSEVPFTDGEKSGLFGIIGSRALFVKSANSMLGISQKLNSDEEADLMCEEVTNILVSLFIENTFEDEDQPEFTIPQLTTSKERAARLQNNRYIHWTSVEDNPLCFYVSESE